MTVGTGFKQCLFNYQRAGYVVVKDAGKRADAFDDPLPVESAMITAHANEQELYQIELDQQFIVITHYVIGISVVERETV